MRRNFVATEIKTHTRRTGRLTDSTTALNETKYIQNYLRSSKRNKLIARLPQDRRKAATPEGQAMVTTTSTNTRPLFNINKIKRPDTVLQIQTDQVLHQSNCIAQTPILEINNCSSDQCCRKLQKSSTNCRKLQKAD